ncbi:hypothetical protein NIES4071_42190 [Calothrix sp. NIES-4071]|nr:hypothetical protein NIES4071_42190 [Calothrix sp. NIES-4071]BAZ58532.1 hypothetical protein NIES4105_42110 [Calothrix sp. NIES-4105]
MGRWTPLVLMAGGLAILLGTLIGSLYPMGGPQTAQAPQNAPNRASSVLPANLNVNTTTSGSGNRGAVAQNNAGSSDNNNTTTNNTNIDQNQSTTSGSNSNSGNAPIRALW